jgi:protein SCO1
MKGMCYTSILCCALSFYSTYAQSARVPIGIVEKLGHYMPMDVELYDESGKLVQLGSIMNKPTIVMFVYYQCPGICTPLLNDVVKVVDKMDLVIGKDYQILTVSFDHTELPETASEKKDNYLGEIRKTVDPNGWRFFTGDSANIYRLTDSMGFYFQRSGKDWVHPAAIMAVAADGKITRYLYGIHQLPLDVQLAMMEASTGKTGPTIAKVLNFCYAYDPEGRHYTLNVVRISGVVIVGLVGIFMIVFVRKPKKKAER